MEFKAIDYEVTNTAGTIIASIDPAERYFSLQTRESSSPYLTVEVDDDYSPKSIMVRVDGQEVKMSWKEFERMVRAQHAVTLPNTGTAFCADTTGRQWWSTEPDGTCKAQDWK